MIDFTNALLEQIIVHSLGNKQKEEKYIASQEITILDAELDEIMLNLIAKAFSDTTEIYHFVHEVDMSYNVVNGVVKEVFQSPASFVDNSIKILKHLYDQSEHQHIKSGDLFIVELSTVFFDDDEYQAVAIFKSEKKDSFLKLSEKNSQLQVNKEEGISIKKMDKACLIINTKETEGYRVLLVDNNKYDTEYWIKAFLGVDLIKDDNYETKNYISLCKSFAKDVIAEQVGKKEQIDFLSQSVKYFEKNDKLESDDFIDKIFENDESKEVFKDYKKKYEKTNDVEIADSFELSKNVVKKQKKSLNSLIKLDTNIQIKLDFKNEESSNRFVEKGFDEEKEMYFYKVYYNKEL
jgi:hypothetical protein